METKGPRPRTLRLALYVVLTAGAGAAGVWSELVAHAGGRAEFRSGPGIESYWEGFDGPDSRMSLWAARGVAGPGLPAQGATMVALAGYSVHWEASTVHTVYGLAQIDPAGLTASRYLDTVRLSTRFPVTVRSWDTRAGWTDRPSLARVEVEQQVIGAKLSPGRNKQSLERNSIVGNMWSSRSLGLESQEVTGVGSVMIDDQSLMLPPTSHDWGSSYSSKTYMEPVIEQPGR